MKVEDQVINLAFAKKLKALKFYQYSEFYWWEKDGKFRLDHRSHLFLDNKIISAFTASELEILLPDETRIERVKDTYIVTVRNLKTRTEYVHGSSLPAAIAKMLVYLKENNLI